MDNTSDKNSYIIGYSTDTFTKCEPNYDNIQIFIQLVFEDSSRDSRYIGAFTQYVQFCIQTCRKRHKTFSISAARRTNVVSYSNST